MSVGAHQLIRTGAATLVTSAAEVIDLAGQIGVDMAEPPRGPITSRDALPPELAQVLEGMPARQAAPPDEIAVQAGVRLSDALRTLSRLIGDGLVEEHGNGYRLTNAGRR